VTDDAEDVIQARARRIMRAVSKKSIKYGGDAREKVQRVPFPGGPCYGPRDHLVEALAAAVGDEHAASIVDALGYFLQADPADQVPAIQWQPQNPYVELDKTIKERDEAVARAERAERDLAKTKTPRRPNKRPREADLKREAL
jgi:hypothetical protein